MSVKTMLPFEYHAPESLKEAFDILDKYQDKAKLLSGGTDVVPKLKGRVLNADHIVDISGIKDLYYIEYDEKDGLRIGANTKLRVIESNEIVVEKYPALSEGCHSIASTQIRNSGTIVGNICNAVPSCDSAPGLLVLGAKVKICSSKVERIVPIEEFFTGVCKTVVEPNEIVTEVIVPAPVENSKSIYFSHTERRALDLAVVGVAANAVVVDGVCEDIRIGLGAVAVTPKRAEKAEALLKGKKLTKELVEQAAEIAGEEDCAPITDMRATKEFRREIVKVLTRNAVNETAGL